MPISYGINLIELQNKILAVIADCYQYTTSDTYDEKLRYQKF